MVRHCSAPDCTESDRTILSHRYPKDRNMAVLWQQALGLQKKPLDELVMKFSVCTKHFSAAAYRNTESNSLNSTAIPSLNEHPNNHRISSTRNREKKSVARKNPYKRPATNDTNESESPRKVIKVALENLRNTKEECDKTIANESTAEALEEEYEEEYTIENEYTDPEPQLEPEINEFSANKVNKILVKEELIMKSVAVQTTEMKIEDSEGEAESRDDRLIKLLYPEFKNFSKLDLIKLILEKNDAIRQIMK